MQYYIAATTSKRHTNPVSLSLSLTPAPISLSQMSTTESFLLSVVAMTSWKNANACSLCQTDFSLFRRRHHCRGCGESFCYICLPGTTHFANVSGEERCCERCKAKPDENKVRAEREDAEERASRALAAAEQAKKEAEEKELHAQEAVRLADEARKKEKEAEEERAQKMAVSEAKRVASLVRRESAADHEILAEEEQAEALEDARALKLKKEMAKSHNEEQKKVAEAAKASDSAAADEETKGKRIKKIKKLLKGIEGIKEKDPEELNDDQRAKLDNEVELLRELASLG